MPLRCSFQLNGKARSYLVCAGVGTFAGYSGNGRCINNPQCAAKPGDGPLPAGRYYIFGRGSGGIATRIRDWALATLDYSDHRKWFALYRDDGRIDDVTFVNGVRRGEFRLHPDGPLHFSKGCLTIANQADFNKLADYLHRQGATLPTPVGMAYGTIEVRP